MTRHWDTRWSQGPRQLPWPCRPSSRLCTLTFVGCLHGPRELLFCSFLAETPFGYVGSLVLFFHNWSWDRLWKLGGFCLCPRPGHPGGDAVPLQSGPWVRGCFAGRSLRFLPGCDGRCCVRAREQRTGGFSCPQPRVLVCAHLSRQRPGRSFVLTVAAPSGKEIGRAHV